MDAARTSQDMPAAPDMSPERGPAGDAGRLYEDLIQAHAAGVWRMAYRLTGDHGDADDLCQEAYYEAWRSIRSLRDPQAGRAWLIRILVHRASRRMRRIRLQPNEERTVHEDLDADLTAVPEGSWSGARRISRMHWTPWIRIDAPCSCLSSSRASPAAK